jgi:hypothetical protein
MAIAALAVSLAAVVLAGVGTVVAIRVASRQLTLARHANAVPVLVGLYGEHRGKRLADARRFVYHDLGSFDPKNGLDALDAENRELVRDLAWFYDNLGALVAHDVVDIDFVSGFLGGSVASTWTELEPFIRGEREKRKGHATDPERWQMYFENLATLVRETPPQVARSRQKLWRLEDELPSAGAS